MDVAPPNQHPATSDDELAKVLAGIGADDSTQHTVASGLQFEETPGPVPSVTPGSANVNNPIPPVPAQPQPTPMAQSVAPNQSVTTAPPTFAQSAGMPGVGGGLDELKKTALEELRPLVGKLDLPPEDKFDTLLLIIRSTDDQSLLTPAHEAAKAITDETKRAQALLDVIKEIDYFSQSQQPIAQ